MNTYIKIAFFTILAVGTIGIAHADFMPKQTTFQVANVRVVRFTDPDNGNTCYVVLSTTTEAMNSISCVNK